MKALFLSFAAVALLGFATAPDPPPVRGLALAKVATVTAPAPAPRTVPVVAFLEATVAEYPATVVTRFVCVADAYEERAGSLPGPRITPGCRCWRCGRFNVASSRKPARKPYNDRRPDPG